MKRTCNGCKALHFEQGGIITCELKFKLNDKSFAPIEECSKPKTFRELANELRYKHVR